MRSNYTNKLYIMLIKESRCLHNCFEYENKIEREKVKK